MLPVWGYWIHYSFKNINFTNSTISFLPFSPFSSIKIEEEKKKQKPIRKNDKASWLFFNVYFRFFLAFREIRNQLNNIISHFSK